MDVPRVGAEALGVNPSVRHPRSSIFRPTARRRRRTLRPTLHLGDRTDLAFAVELRPVHAMQLHELARQFQRLVLRCDLDQRIAADDLLALGERTIRHAELATAGPHAERLARRRQAGRVLEHTLLEALLDERTMAS